MFDNIRRDLQTYQNDWGAQGFWVMGVYRFGRWRYGVKPPIVRKLFSLLYKLCFKLIQIITGIELPCEVPVGKNFRIDHFGDIIISGYASFGDDCILRNGVTVGLKNVETKAAPRIGNRVNIGAGAKVLGPITVVLCDVPPYSIGVGIPARIIAKKEKTVPSGSDTCGAIQ